MASMGQPQSQPQAPAAPTPAACHAACASEAVVESCAAGPGLSGSESLDWRATSAPRRSTD
ncbi:hypothetical protein LNO89_24805 [Klebsiella pneumoniae subsp. pneumoniae]|nr:hypothetical protein [Klebsiella pneumoniae subsp. pneumoniae]